MRTLACQVGGLEADAATLDLLARLELSARRLGELLGRIEAETLVITGRDDFICGPAAAQVLADGIPHAELVVVEEAGHMLHLEQPEAFSRAVESFLAR